MIVIINIALLLFVFAAQKKKKSPYAAALALGVIKTGIYILWTSRIVLALGMGIIFAALAAGIIFLLGRIDRPRGGAKKRFRPIRLAVPIRLNFGGNTFRSRS